MLLSAEHISKNYGMRQLLEDVSLYLNENDRIGIVGVNGTGKSTLLKILAGIESADVGVITKKPNLKTVYLPQNPTMNDNFTVLEQVFANASSEFRGVHGYEAKSILNRLGIVDFDVKISTLSGGQRKRVALAGALIHQSDILILDEPTNHLDSEMVCWLEQYLCRFSGGLIMVTHDRYFLERVVNRITELSNGKLFSYEANYSKYLELKAQRSEMNDASERKRQATLRKEYQWIMQGPKARGTKSRDRIERYETLKDQTALLANDAVQIATMASRLGRKIIELNDVTKTFADKNVITNFSYTVLRDDRIGIVGRNGAGKSTLLNLITGQLTPDSGFVDVGTTVKTGYFMQECCELDPNQRVYDFICDIASEIKTNDGTFSATQMLERFLFSTDLQYTNIGRLSGGERRRLYLLSILMTAPNILLLDEPTNDLDIETLTILEDYLESFPGAVMAVSHDRYFLDKVATSIFEVAQDGIINSYNGNYSDYSQKRTPEQPQSTKAKTSPERLNIGQKSDDTRRSKKLKFTFKEQLEFDTINDDIAALEAQIASCTAEILGAASDYVRLQTLMEQRENIEAALDEKTFRWVYLSELYEKISL